ncbi:hypothetical protein ACFOEE_02280 [Pseudoalteromonas fenneropenaei]|uniref:Lipoprotein n=1 Tax=Pseudoalteromonas fenneropenaei TaxID=1737459 RepID=A0ABV7CFH3_9GAMM
MKLFAALTLTTLLAGCSTNPQAKQSNYYCHPNQVLAIVCLGAAVVEALTYTSDKRCDEMMGERRKQCEAQVESITKHINDSKKGQ